MDSQSFSYGSVFELFAKSPRDTGRKVNVHKMFTKRPERFLNFLCTLNLRPVSSGRAPLQMFDWILNTSLTVVP